MTPVLKSYIEEQQVCSELIFRDWDDFLKVLFENGGTVEMIVWFEYVLIKNQADSLGAGGYRDSQNPDFMWAETQIFNDSLEGKSASEIKKYIKETIKNYSPQKLVPCFYI